MPVNAQAYHKIIQELNPYGVTLVAVSKTKTMDDILSLYDLGHRDFGENYVQELTDKYQALPKDIRWHFIGHLQTNKVKYISSFVHLIHAVDSEKLLSEINKQGTNINRVIPCLLQMYISKDETKFGFNEQELETILSKASGDPGIVKSVAIRGLMGMATFTEDNDLIKSEFALLKKLFDSIKVQSAAFSNEFSILSMGMSADYMIAVEAGSTMVRIGSLLFGERNYHS